MMPTLRIEEVSKRFHGVQALDHVNIDINEGEVLGLVGPNGSGKTTLFNCVTGFVRASSGRVLWNGRDTTRLAPDQMARLGVVRTFQQKMVFPSSTVRENVEMAWCARRDDGASLGFQSCDQIMEFFGLLPMQEMLAGDIPFGSARKLGIGLALAVNPKLLLLDEPAAGLNQEESEELGRLITQIAARGVTICVIEHDVPLVMSTCQRVVVLHAGRKIAEGLPADVSNDPSVISVFLGEKFARRSRGQ